MGCFIACFGSSDDVKRRKQKRKVQPRDQANPISKLAQASSSDVNSVSDGPISPILKARDKPEEQKVTSSTRKRVTFDSNVKTYELDHVHEEADHFLEKGRMNEDEKDLSKRPQCKSHSEVGSAGLTFPPNHRYQNCRDSDDEDELLDYADSDLGHDNIDDDVNDNDNDDIDDKEYSDFSEDEDGITESSGKGSAAQAFPEVESCLSVCRLTQKTETSIGLNRRYRNADVHPVLKPVENLSQWKAVKVKGTLPSNPHKENVAKSRICQSKNSGQDIAVDASLSNWLSSSEATPTSKSSRSISCALMPESQGSNSFRSEEDRPILGALTVEELKQFSTSPSPRRSPNRNPDEMPIIGTVGSYWNHSGTVEDSGSASSCKRVSSNSKNYGETHLM